MYLGSVCSAYGTFSRQRNPQWVCHGKDEWGLAKTRHVNSTHILDFQGSLQFDGLFIFNNLFNFQINVVSLAYAHETMDVVRNQQNLTREAVCLGSPENTGLLHRWTGQPGTSWRQNKLERFSDRIWGDNTHCHPVSACGKRSCTSIEVVFRTRRTLVRNGLPRHTEQTKHAPGCFS